MSGQSPPAPLRAWVSPLWPAVDRSALEPLQLQTPVWPSSTQTAIYTCSRCHSCSAPPTALLAPALPHLYSSPSLPSSRRPSCYPVCAPALLCVGASEPLSPRGTRPPCEGAGKKTTQRCVHTHSDSHTPPQAACCRKPTQPNCLFLSLSLSLFPASSHEGWNLKFQHPMPPLSPPPPARSCSSSGGSIWLTGK